MAGLTRCPSAATINLARSPSVSSLRRAPSASAVARRPSLECNAALLPDQPSDEGWSEWGLDAAMLPWGASPSLPSRPQRHSEHDEHDERQALTFFPSSQQLDRAFSQPSAPAGRAQPTAAPRDGTCHIILFGVGEELTEGIYTLRTQDYVNGEFANVDTVVAFEDGVDGERFATMLEASLGHEPTVFPISWADITEWCNENNTRCRLEPAGSLIMPPSSNLGVTDWERLLSLRRNQYQVLDEEPEIGGPATAAPGFFIDGPEWVYHEEAAADTNNIVDSKLADPKSRAAARRDLERAFNMS